MSRFLLLLLLLAGAVLLPVPVLAQTATPTSTATVTPTATAMPVPAFGPVTLRVSDEQATQDQGASVTAGLGLGFFVVVVGIFLHVWTGRR